MSDLVTSCFLFLSGLWKSIRDSPVACIIVSAVTPRTAGFNTTDLSMLTGASKAMMILLMLIGGSPSSTAGGMKTTTFALLLLNVLATFQSCDDVTAFGRRIDVSVIKKCNNDCNDVFYLVFLQVE